MGAPIPGSVWLAYETLVNLVATFWEYAAWLRYILTLFKLIDRVGLLRESARKDTSQAIQSVQDQTPQDTGLTRHSPTDLRAKGIQVSCQLCTGSYPILPELRPSLASAVLLPIWEQFLNTSHLFPAGDQLWHTA